MSSIERIFAWIAQAIDIYFGASAVVWAIEERRRPDPDDLRRLGIDPRAYFGIGRG